MFLDQNPENKVGTIPHLDDSIANFQQDYELSSSESSFTVDRKGNVKKSKKYLFLTKGFSPRSEIGN